MKRKDYIKPFVKFILIETGDSLLYAGSPENSGDVVLPNDGTDPMDDEINKEVQPQPGGGGTTIPEPD